MITRGEASLNDHWLINFGSLTQESEQTFQLEHKDMRSIPYNNHWQKTISYEVSLDQLLFRRIVYSKLDFLRDLGGLIAAMYALCDGIIVIF